MPSIDEPDYSNYTLEELYDVAQHIDRVRYAARYHRVLEEFEKRSGVPMPTKAPRYTMRAWLTKRLWEHGDARRDFRATIAWWEERRRFYNVFFFAVAGSSALTAFALAFVKDFREGSGVTLLAPVDLLLISLLTALSLAVMGGALCVCINLLYILFWLLDGALLVPLRFLGWRLSVALLGIVLSLTLLVLSLPAVLAFATLLRR